MNDLARRGIRGLKLYVPGKPIEEVQREYGISDIVKLASNENPMGTSPKAVEAMKNAASSSYLYPDPISHDLCRVLSERFRVSPAQLLISNGMDNILALIAQAFLNEGEEVLTCSPSFAAYYTNCVIMGGVFKTVPLSEHRFDLKALKAAITDKTKLVFICNPNNPTGTIVTAAEVAEFMDGLPDNLIVVFDEAYAEFVDNSEYAQGMKYVFEKRNVIVTRTFSKLYGLAGNRVGYAIAPEHIMDILKRVVEPFPVNRIAQAGALAALDDDDFIKKTLSANKEGMDYLTEALSSFGAECIPSYANFLWADIKHPSRELEEKLLRRGVIVRPGHLWGFDTYLRITIGTIPQLERFISALGESLAD